MRGALAAGACAAAVLTCLGSSAWAATILVVRSRDAGAVIDEATIRLHAELSAAGFETQAADVDAGADPRVEAEAAAAKANVDATLLLLPAPSGADVWLADPASHRTIVERVAIDPSSPQAASVIAVGAVELLRATRVASAAPAAEPPPPHADRPSDGDLAAPRAAPPPPRRGLLAGGNVAAGVATLIGGGGMGPAFGPLLRLSYGIGHFAGRVSAIGPTIEPRITAAGGSASVLRAVFDGELVATTAGANAAWVPFLSLGLGTSYVRVGGSPSAGFTGVTSDGFFFSSTLGAGLAFRFAERSAVVIDGGPSWTLPDPSVRIAGVDAGHAGSPFLRSSLAVTTSL